MGRSEDLMPRELEILLSIAAGWPSNEMAEALDLSESDAFAQLEQALARIRGGRCPSRSTAVPFGTKGPAAKQSRPALVPERDWLETRPSDCI